MLADGTFLVKAPKLVSNTDIQRFIDKNRSWVESMCENYNLHSAYRTPDSGEDSPFFYYLGDQYRLVLTTSQQKILPFFSGSDFCFYVSDSMSSSDCYDAFLSWYKGCSLDVFTDRVDYFCKRLGVEVTLVRVKELKSRWGSCSSVGSINLNWKLIKAPLDIIDYVVAHECAHLVHMNHSRDFWACVASIYPGYKEAKSWLRQYGPFMLF